MDVHSSTVGKRLPTLSIDTEIRFLGWRGDPHFVFAYLVAADVPPEGAGNYHLADYSTSPANDLGQASKAGVTAPGDDIDGDLAADMGFNPEQIKSRQFRAERDGQHITRILTDE